MLIETDKWDAMQDAFREVMLDAMDRHFETLADGGAQPGPRDADLPDLFRALDRQFELCMTRLGFTVAVED